jgi:uncharacterized protein (TIGR00255 family)
MSNLRSMTGFARVRRPFGEGELVVSLKSLNHRGLDLQVYAPNAIDPIEAAMRAMIKTNVLRGHVEVRVSLPQSSASGPSVTLNRALLDQYMTAFREASDAHGLAATPDLSFAFRIPGMLADAGESEAPAGIEPVLLDALSAALDQLNEFRAREGGEIATELRGHNAKIQTLAEEMEKIRGSATAAFQARLSDRLKELLKGVQIEPQRLAQEAAVLADRSDIGEELARLKIHAVQLAALLESGGEVGKRLDFLLQEMNRETNTILSKTSGIGEVGLRITELGLAAKSSIEKIREQSLNLE